MRYLVRERIFSIGDKFDIQDESGRNVYEVAGKVFSFGNKLNIFDMSGNNLIYIEQKIFKFLPEYYIYMGDKIVANVKKEFTFFRPKFNIFSDFGDFTLEGDIFAHDFSIFKDGNEICRVNKKWISISDAYGVEIFGDEDPAFILALCIVFDQVLYDNNGSKNA
ncbi:MULTISPECIES: LURP-one-related/scramblase family protein [Tissierellales]|jgi:uncharacterized protein YxjI|uniref:LURP-one-related family protein n=1 Tax=Acidilutibacter cellobiosedens TaxID=2507161 RepID=A0A410QFL5_9FIRM|nr:MULTISPECIES: LURP-one-related family protein [Tissierellales]MBE6083112.1 hypothetical protein [Tissierellaceae bacterium]QAT62800.1 hypothetical protein EQM13_15110 [Acidilutibacter cellobiosedens]SCL93298.1 hypothetical protein PP176A_2458 [Sporanaerobacter sp. PP17-6a]